MLAQWPYQDLEHWHLFQVIYKGFDQNIGNMVEFMCQGEFLKKSEIESWKFLEELVEKILLWETTRDKSLGARISSKKGGIHAIMNTTYINTFLAAIKKICCKDFVMSQAPNNFSPSQTVSCSRCQFVDHSLSTCPLFAQQLATSQK